MTKEKFEQIVKETKERRGEPYSAVLHLSVGMVLTMSESHLVYEYIKKLEKELDK